VYQRLEKDYVYKLCPVYKVYVDLFFVDCCLSVSFIINYSNAKQFVFYYDNNNSVSTYEFYYF